MAWRPDVLVVRLMKKRIVIIGGGPGGYVAAIRAAQLGAEVHLVECGNLGGTCLNVGCIPTKVLLHTAEEFRKIQKSAAHGLIVDGARIDWPTLLAHKMTVVKRLVQGVGGLLKANRVKVHQGRAILQDAHTVTIEGNSSTAIKADAIVLAVGSTPAQIPLPGTDLPGVIDSTAALSLPEIPTSLLVVGGGVIGTEFAALYSSLGTKVTVIEMLPQILPPVDTQLVTIIKKELRAQGVEFFTSAKVVEIAEGNNDLTARVLVGQEEQRLTGQHVLIAVGRRPNTDGLGLESVGVKLERGAIPVDKHFTTHVPGIYAIGDCNAQMMLAHAASAQGVAAVEHIMGHTSFYNKNVIPYCVYTSPEIAGVGLTEEQAKAEGLAYQVGLFPLTANGKSIIENGERGLVKIIADEKFGEILGVHLIGPRATDLIGEMALAMTLEASVDEIIATIHPHPTVSESLLESALAVKGSAVHWPPGIAIPE